MPAQRVLVVDENQTFCNQVVAAFSEAGIDARGSARGNEALMLAGSIRQSGGFMAKTLHLAIDPTKPRANGRA